MRGLWLKMIAKLTFWLVAEIVLNFMGIDDLADYSEFVFDKKFIAHLSCVYTNSLT